MFTARSFMLHTALCFQTSKPIVFSLWQINSWIHHIYSAHQYIQVNHPLQERTCYNLQVPYLVWCALKNFLSRCNSTLRKKYSKKGSLSHHSIEECRLKKVRQTLSAAFTHWKPPTKNTKSPAANNTKFEGGRDKLMYDQLLKAFHWGGKVYPQTFTILNN